MDNINITDTAITTDHIGTVVIQIENHVNHQCDGKASAAV
jgi:hypothetical protein